MPPDVPTTDPQLVPSYTSTLPSAVFQRIIPSSTYGAPGLLVLSPTGITNPYVPANFTYPLFVFLNSVTLFETRFVI